MFYFIVFLFLIDRLLKQFFLTSGRDGGFFLLPGILKVGLHENYGIAFSFPLPQIIIVSLSTLVLIILFFALIKTRDKKKQLGLFLIIIGALSNLADRLIYGFVIDYINLFKLSFSNIADIMVWIGIILLIF